MKTVTLPISMTKFLSGAGTHITLKNITASRSYTVSMNTESATSMYITFNSPDSGSAAAMYIVVGQA